MAKPVWRADFARYPLVLVYVTGSDGSTPPDMQSMLDTIEEVSARHSPKAIVIDMTYARPDAARRKQFIEGVKLRWARLRNGTLIAVAPVAPGAMQRAAITAILWFVKPPCPMEVFERREDAVQWASAQLAAAGHHVPRRV